MTSSGRPVVSIQLLRALAATAVVVTHFQLEMIKILGVDGAGFSMTIGAAGVDLFFVISGFVMVYSAEPLFGRRDAPFVFFVHRLARIVPTYWIATTVYVLMAAAIPAFGRDYSASFIASSYLFIPAVKTGIDIEPVVGQGWTLNYEMFFYFVFALAILATRNTAVVIIASALCGIVVLGSVLPSLPVSLEFWSQSIVLEFVFGMIIAVAYRSGIRTPRVMSVLLLLTGLAAFPLCSAYLPSDASIRFLRWGLPAALVVTAAALGNPSLNGRLWSWFLLVGDASYALYLFHALPIRALLYAVRWARLDGVRLYWPLLIAAVLASVGLALAIYFLFERPITQKLRQYLTRYEVSWNRLLTSPEQVGKATKVRV